MSDLFNLTGFSRLVAAGVPLLYVVTGDEERTCALISLAARRGIKGMPEPHLWDCVGGFAGREGTTDPVAALRWALEQPGPALFVFRDLSWFWGENPYVQRLLREFAARRGGGRTLVVLGADAALPPALRGAFHLLDHALPDRAEIRRHLEALAERDPQVAAQAAGAALDALVVAAQGLDFGDIDRALRLARLGPERGPEGAVVALHQAKQQLLRKSGVLEFVANDLAADQVGGMENLKDWLAKREQVFGKADLAAGRNLPRGVLIMGISGCGKSLFVKAIAARWRLPLVRLDMATVYGGTFGSPETSLRRACRTAEAMAPCVLWIDEMESGISTQGFKSDGGAASRVLGYFLTWMQEKTAPVFVAATANAIEMLPAEVLRKGRFDEIFYVALPEVAERAEIFRIHLARRDDGSGSWNLGMLAHSAKGFSGAEIEQAVASAFFEARARQRPMTQQDVMEAISRTVPLSVTMAEQIKRIEAWAFKRAVPASRPAAKGE